MLVIGASGFLGSVLCEELLKQKHNVIGVGRKEKGFLPDEVIENENFLYLKCDINNIKKEYLKNAKIEAIFHLASLVEYASSDYSDYSENTIKTTLNVVKLCKEIKAKQIIYSSTLGLITKEHDIVNENTQISPNSNYGLAKYTCEKLLEFETKKDLGIQMTCIRFPAIFGKNHLGGIVHTLKEAALKNEDIELYDRGIYKRNIIYSKEAARIMILANTKIKNLNKFEIFTAGSKNSLSLLDITKKIIKLTNSNSKIILSEKKAPNSFDSFLDLQKAENILNFKPISIDEGLVEYIKELGV